MSCECVLHGMRAGGRSGAVGVLVISSSGSVIRLLDVCIGGRNCRIRHTCGKGRTVAGLGAGPSVNLVVLSVVVPRVSNLTIIERIEGSDRVPMLVLSTGASSLSGVRNLVRNTSSCIAGPFGPLRIVTHIGSLLHHDRRSIGGSRPSRVRVNPLVVGGSSRRIRAIANGSVRLATLRFNVLCLLTDRPGEMFSTSRVFRHI